LPNALILAKALRRQSAYSGQLITTYPILKTAFVKQRRKIMNIDSILTNPMMPFVPYWIIFAIFVFIIRSESKIQDNLLIMIGKMLNSIKAGDVLRANQQKEIEELKKKLGEK